jgi:hypothetical protein
MTQKARCQGAREIGRILMRTNAATAKQAEGEGFRYKYMYMYMTFFSTSLPPHLIFLSLAGLKKNQWLSVSHRLLSESSL